MFMRDISRSAVGFHPVESVPQSVSTGLVAGTLVETAIGWRAVETLQIGDAIHTLDGGLARLLGLDRKSIHPDSSSALLLIPGGAFDACCDLLVLPGQHVLLDTLNDPEVGGAPFAMLPAIALCASGRVSRQPFAEPIEIITPLFADEEVIFANSGVMLHCPGIADGAGRYPEDSFFPRLQGLAARAFVQRRAARLAA